MRAFGGELTYLCSHARLDVAVFQGPKGPHFDLYPGFRSPGTRVELVSYPQAVDLALEARNEPACSSGQVCTYNPTGTMGISDYQGGRF